MRGVSKLYPRPYGNQYHWRLCCGAAAWRQANGGKICQPQGRKEVSWWIWFEIQSKLSQAVSKLESKRLNNVFSIFDVLNLEGMSQKISFSFPLHLPVLPFARASLQGLGRLFRKLAPCMQSAMCAELGGSFAKRETPPISSIYGHVLIALGLQVLTSNLS